VEGSEDVSAPTRGPRGPQFLLSFREVKGQKEVQLAAPVSGTFAREVTAPAAAGASVQSG